MRRICWFNPRGPLRYLVTLAHAFQLKVVAAVYSVTRRGSQKMSQLMHAIHVCIQPDNILTALRSRVLRSRCVVE